jgi:hypothetical protein
VFRRLTEVIEDIRDEAHGLDEFGNGIAGGFILNLGRCLNSGAEAVVEILAASAHRVAIVVVIIL